MSTFHRQFTSSIRLYNRELNSTILSNYSHVNNQDGVAYSGVMKAIFILIAACKPARIGIKFTTDEFFIAFAARYSNQDYRAVPARLYPLMALFALFGVHYTHFPRPITDMHVSGFFGHSETHRIRECNWIGCENTYKGDTISHSVLMIDQSRCILYCRKRNR